VSDLADARYQLIAPLLRRYKRRFTVLDLGAGINPYMAQRISREFDAVVVALEQDEIAPEELAKFGPRALWLRKKMSFEDMLRLVRCERFDVVLALNILHHFGEEWDLIAGTLQLLGHEVIVQTPDASDEGTCGRDITPAIQKWLDGERIGDSIQFPSHNPRPIYRLDGSVLSTITMSSWTSPVNCIEADIWATHSSCEIRLRHKGIGYRPYIHGLNLWNFAQLNGQWPRKEQVLKLIHEFPLRQERHGDITPHNFLFDGAELHLIDGYEGWEFDDKENLAKTERMMAEVLQ